MVKKIIRISESQIPERLRGSRSKILRKIARFVINISGWTIKGKVPNEERIVIIVAPHTSNWDFILAMLAIFGLNIKVRWLGKNSIFKPGFKLFFEWLGGIPVYRDNPSTLIEKVVTIVKKEKSIVIAMTPEGTRKKVKRWKTGFLRIAKQTQSKILLISIDAPTKSIEIGKIFNPTGNNEEDLYFIQEYYSTFRGINPQKS
ncbi:1-acyl-sn-glycerol-3-phosphate acyltransferase [OCS116 cluster bacterium]|nr:1-acyl-sn-glycerol-3-phosphate acyltransferase [OCS116 cluster bacterium]